MHWPQLLSFSLWIAPHALLIIVVIFACRRRLYLDFPIFFSYAIYEIVQFLFLFAMAHFARGQYVYAFSVTLLVSIALRFGVIEEVSKDLFREYRLLNVVTRRSLQWTKGLLALIGIVCAVYAPGANTFRLIGGLTVVNRGVAIIQCGLLVFLLCFSRLLGLSWRGYAFGIAFGLGILSSVDLATSAIRAELTGESWGQLLNLVTMGAYLVCVSVWLRYLLAPERKPALLPDVPHDEVENWSKELQQLLRQ